ncbi:hypothetical protein Tco_1469745, partial [Tanacetum coccineum]
MAPLPHCDLRHPWLRYQAARYTKDIVHNYERRLEAIWGRSVNRVHILDFEDLTPKMRQDLAVRLRMVYVGDDGNRHLMSDTKMGLDVASMLCFQLGGVRRSMTCRQFILALGLHTEFLRATPSYVHIRDPVRRLCHRMLACTISGQGQGPEKVTEVDLFYLRTMDRGTANVPYLLAQYLFKHAEGRKTGARLFGGHFIGRLTNYFGLVSDEGLRGLTRIERIKEEMRELRQSFTGLRGVIESSIIEQAKVSTLMIS